ncbi:hypothetical protein B0H13DRAFT_2047996, partial [Mycena leptocephala]
MRTARLARCSVPFAPGRRRGCGTSPRLTTRCDERGAMELEHIERILSRSTHPQCTGRRSRRLRALLMRFWLAHPPLIHCRTVRRTHAARFLRSAQSRYRLGRSRAEPGSGGTACGLYFGKGGRGRWYASVCRSKGKTRVRKWKNGYGCGGAWWEIRIPRVGCPRCRRRPS